MFGDIVFVEWIKMNVNMKKVIFNILMVFNNIFYGIDGVVLEFSGLNVILENNLFEYNDWIVVNMVYKSGGLGMIIFRGIGDIFVRNILWYNGVSSGIRFGLWFIVWFNYLYY